MNDEKLNIAILTGEFVTEKYFSGGVAQHFYRIAKYLVEQGHRVHVITRSHETSEFIFQSLQIYRINVNTESYPIKLIKKIIAMD